MIYKMRGWDWENIHKRPAVVGQWINDIVYKRLGPGVLEELKQGILKTIKDISLRKITSFYQKILASLN